MSNSKVPDRTFAQEAFSRPSRVKIYGDLDINGLFEFLGENYSIKVPDGFPEHLMNAHSKCSEADFLIPARTVDALVSVCDEWKQYLSEQSDYLSLFCHELLSMVRTHVSVFSVYFLERAGFQLINKPVSSYALIVSQNGGIREMR